jgi:hypothetical protein
VAKSGQWGEKRTAARFVFVWVCVVGKTPHKHKQIWFLKCCERVWLDDLSGGCKGTVGKEGGGGGGGARGGEEEGGIGVECSLLKTRDPKAGKRGCLPRRHRMTISPM